MILKTNLISAETDRQLFITNRPSLDRSSRVVLDRILLHWDTETGVFRVKDNTFQEDKIRYKTISWSESTRSLLNIAWNCLSAPIFNEYWHGELMNYRIQFWKDNPEYNPFSGKS